MKKGTEKKTVVPLIRDTFLAVVENSVGSRQFRSFFAKVGNRRVDIMHNGDLSCAFYVSGILTMCGFIDHVHGTVGGTVKALEDSGWKRVSTAPRAGDVLVWEAKMDARGELNRHIGFALSKDDAVSNSSKKRSIAKHHITFGVRKNRPVRAIAGVYRMTA